MRTAALIAAAGSGSRLGQGPKAFVSVRGSTLLEHSLRAFAGHVDELVVAVPAEHAAGVMQHQPGVTVVPGGTTRQASVAAMLAATDAPMVLVHDVARPFLTGSVIQRVKAAALAAGAASAALDVADTVFDTLAGVTLDRSTLRLVQTPQGFDRQLLLEAHAAALASGVAATDDADLVRRLGRRVELVPGSRLLHKVTEAGDLTVVEALYDLWQARLREALVDG